MSAAFIRRTVDELIKRPLASSSPELLAAAAAIVDDVRVRGETAVREYAMRFDSLAPNAPMVIGRSEMQAALRTLAPDDCTRLTRISDRIRAFAEGQLRSLASFELDIPGGIAGHQIAPVQRAGCYAPGGRYPLPSSLLMTALTARAAGVGEVWVASPSVSPIMLACAAVADVDGFLAVGGAQAIAALAFGAGPVPACDVIAGPGNAWVTAAKRVVFGHVGIDALAGPSELVILADDGADASTVAADLLAQAEHDPLSIPILVTDSERVANRVSGELRVQLESLPTGGIARAALANGGFVLTRNLSEGMETCDRLAPEHLHLHVNNAESIAPRLTNYGALFIGAPSAEVLGDYGAGPNHVLPTGRASRFSGGLSVLTFLRVRTWLAVQDAPNARELYEDAAWLGRVEGLEAHARSAERRLEGHPHPGMSTASRSSVTA